MSGAACSFYKGLLGDCTVLMGLEAFASPRNPVSAHGGTGIYGTWDG